MVQSMKPGSIIVDMAAEQGGNCELTEPGQVTVRHGVAIIGYSDLPSRLSKQSSTLYATNLFRLAEELCKSKDGTIDVNMDDEVHARHDGRQGGHDHLAAAGADAVGMHPPPHRPPPPVSSRGQVTWSRQGRGAGFRAPPWPCSSPPPR
jgi:NAD(P) transhydrogenase subunit alpha